MIKKFKIFEEIIFERPDVKISEDDPYGENIWDDEYDDFLKNMLIASEKATFWWNLITAEESKTISFTDIIADTTNLDQVYSDPTLNVSIKYPKGWSFIDQNKRNKLDGVTFWAADGLYNPPPFIHLEVVDKDMFIEKRYAYKIDLKDFQTYYNDPEEIQGYVTQIFYIRTEGDEDFRLKLMMKGEAEFKSFQPRFWAILKSFNFGSSFF